MGEVGADAHAHHFGARATPAPDMAGLIRCQRGQGFVWLSFEPRLEALFRKDNDTAPHLSHILLLAIVALILITGPLPASAFSVYRVDIRDTIDPTLVRVWCCL